MSITALYDAFETVVTTALPSHKRIAQPSDLESNSELSMSQAFGILWQGATDITEFNNMGAIQQSQSLGLVLARRVFATRKDVSSRTDTEKLLHEDKDAVLLGIYADQYFQNQANLVSFESSTPVELLRIEQGRNDILVLNVSLTVEYTLQANLCT